MTETAGALGELSATVLDGPGHLSAGLRRAIEARAAELSGRAVSTVPEVPSDLSVLVDKIALHAYKVTDDDIETLKNSGYTEDAIFEVIVCAALGAGRARFERGIRVLDEGS
jgi:hypothetical protein